MTLESKIIVDLGSKKGIIYFYDSKGWDTCPEDEEDPLTKEDQISLATFIQAYITESISGKSKSEKEFLRRVSARYHDMTGEMLGEICIEDYGKRSLSFR